MKKQAAADPNSYAANKLKQMKPRACSYCNGTGHNRRGCADMKQHKRVFKTDLHIWRRGLHKWAEGVGLGYGALIRSSIYWRDHRGESRDGKESPATLMFVAASEGAENYAREASLTHRYAVEPGIRMHQGLEAEVVGGERHNYTGRMRREALSLPDIPVIAPASGKDGYGYDRTRNDREADWHVVSPSPAPGLPASFSSGSTAQEIADAWFQAGKDANTQREFFELTKEQRKALKDYLNDSATLDELSARVNPTDDNNSDDQNE